MAIISKHWQLKVAVHYNLCQQTHSQMVQFRFPKVNKEKIKKKRIVIIKMVVCNKCYLNWIKIYWNLGWISTLRMN